jgi:hypothetical protein
MMAIADLFSRLRWRRTPQEMTTIVTDMTPVEPPTQQEIIDQLDIDVVRQFQRMLDADAD